MQARDKISIDLNDHEQLMQATTTLSLYASDLVTKLTSIQESLPSLSSEGAFHKYLGDSKDHPGMAIFLAKSKELQTLCEVINKHAENTHQKLVDVDKLQALNIANMILNDPSRSAEEKHYIRTHPKESVETIKERMREAREKGDQP